MAIITLTLRDDFTNYSTRYDLDGKEYIFITTYNSREDRWYLAIQDDEGAHLVNSVKLSIDVDLLRDRRAVAPLLPQGILMLFETTGLFVEMTRTNVAKFTLAYQEVA